ncbi:MAG: bifunctional 4-hydroxy-2-oxoglutarate aldolase/2-dehydro-3-deoxy-phosphogluconate aldolase [Clostridia bacterium]|nr:bifunctional 4-hydroxy-2-oxoglutarate aldolase/2-dehydro-3-deoxy-phosphogluconate aldolase [Clostridia bacterium]
MEIIEKLKRIGVVPVVAIRDSSDSEPLAESLIDGGLPCAEITFRTDAAEESIKKISSRFPEMTVAAGTVLSADQADKAFNAGASLIVSPGFNPSVVEHCLKNGYPIVPGIVTPSEIELALSYGLLYLKFFPAEAAGGLKMIKAMSAPYSNIMFMPTGGISPDNLGGYLSFKKVFACGGSWMVKDSLISERKFDEIKKLTAEAVSIVKNTRKPEV